MGIPTRRPTLKAVENKAIMPLLAWILLFSLVGGALSVLAAAVYLLLPENLRASVLPHLVSFAIGALLGAAFLGLLPHALQGAGIEDFHGLTGTVLLGLLGFFLLEKFVLWRHCHASDCEVHAGEHAPVQTAAGTLILVGDGIHNFVDGILIGGAFITDIHLGIVTSLAVASHEIPQEVGDFAVLLHSGYSRARAFVFNLLASLTTLLGGLLAYYALKDALAVVPYVLAVAAASFIYIAVADLIPSLHRRTEVRATVEQLALITAGVLVIYVTHAWLH
jgi:zinc and cadmium transporter